MNLIHLYSNTYPTICMSKHVTYLYSAFLHNFLCRTTPEYRPPLCWDHLKLVPLNREAVLYHRHIPPIIHRVFCSSCRQVPCCQDEPRSVRGWALSAGAGGGAAASPREHGATESVQLHQGSDRVHQQPPTARPTRLPQEGEQPLQGEALLRHSIDARWQRWWIFEELIVI